MSKDSTNNNTISILNKKKSNQTNYLIRNCNFNYTSLVDKIIVANWLRSPHSARNVIVNAWIKVFDTINKLVLPNRNRHLFGACCSTSVSCIEAYVRAKIFFNIFT